MHAFTFSFTIFSSDFFFFLFWTMNTNSSLTHILLLINTHWIKWKLHNYEFIYIFFLHNYDVRKIIIKWNIVATFYYCLYTFESIRSISVQWFNNLFVCRYLIWWRLEINCRRTMQILPSKSLANHVCVCCGG